MNIRINTQHRFTVSKMPFYRQRNAVSLVVKRPFTTSVLKVHIHSNTWLWVVLDVLSTRSAVIFRSFLSQFWGVKWLGNGRKVTLLRVKDDFGATRRWRFLQQSSTIGAGWVHVFLKIVHPILLDYQAFTRQSSTCSRIIDYIAYVVYWIKAIRRAPLLMSAWIVV